MRILAIETSCDETSAAVLEDDTLISMYTHSQAQTQRQWGGVVPLLARKKHLQNIEGVVAKALIDAGERKFSYEKAYEAYRSAIQKSNSEDLPQAHDSKSYQGKYEQDIAPIQGILTDKPAGIDVIAVTKGPGLALALEVGVASAKQLAQAWGIPVIPVNHMEGHLFSGLIKQGSSALEISINDFVPQGKYLNQKSFALLLSGKHSELIQLGAEGYTKVIETLDDAIGEAYDKFSVMLGLGYPGGPVVDKMARSLESHETNLADAKAEFSLPVPLKGSKKRAFSFSGLKTAALYMLKSKLGIEQTGDLPSQPLAEIFSEKELAQACASFQSVVVESIQWQLKKVLIDDHVEILLTGGGVIANSAIRDMLNTMAAKYNFRLVLPQKNMLPDNAGMIGLAGYLQFLRGFQGTQPGSPEFLELDRDPNWSLETLSFYS